MSTDNFFNFLKIFLLSSASSTLGAIVIRPLICRFLYLPKSGKTSSNSSSTKPYFDASFATFISSNPSTCIFFFLASVSIVSANLILSTECIKTVFPRSCFTLLVCKCPIICHLISFGNSSHFLTSSCTLFSPKSLIPVS